MTDSPAGDSRPDPADAALRALVESIIPQDETIGAGDVNADAFVAHYLEFVQPGLVKMLAAALDGAAAAIAGVPFAPGLFAAADHPARLAAMRALGTHEMPELRELADLAAGLTIAAFYGEWTGQDESGALASTPVGWELTGYAGPHVPANLLSR